MKTFTLFIALLSAADIAAAEKFVVGPPGWPQSIGLNVTEQEDHPRLTARQAGNGRTVILKNRTPQISGSKSVKIRYGPFSVKGGGPYVLSFSPIALAPNSCNF
jgi:hypothetical protein